MRNSNKIILLFHLSLSRYVFRIVNRDVLQHAFVFVLFFSIIKEMLRCVEGNLIKIFFLNPEVCLEFLFKNDILFIHLTQPCIKKQFKIKFRKKIANNVIVNVI